jgi:hypothetical protein
MTWSIERTVAVLTPLFAAAAGVLSGWLAKHAIHVPSDQIVAPMIAGFTVAGGAALTWLHHRAKWVALTQSAAGIEAKVRAEIAANPQTVVPIKDIEELFRTHQAEIEKAIDQHVPVAVGQSINALFSKLGTAGLAPQTSEVPVQSQSPLVQ